MGLMLGNRQLAMLREMGVRVWQPKAASLADADLSSVVGVGVGVNSGPTAADSKPANSLKAALLARAPDPYAINKGAAYPRNDSAAGQNDLNNREGQEGRDDWESREVPATPPLQGAGAEAASGEWFIGSTAELYLPTPQTAQPPTQPSTQPPTQLHTPPGARWLVLLESSGQAEAGGFNPLEGDAGKLLDNMLRAAGLHSAGGVVVAPLLRESGNAGQTRAALVGSLPELVASVQPAVVLVMGRLAAQAALQSAEPLAKLRGRVHQLHGTPCVVTLDAAYLLRNPLHKAMAWDDLCLAISQY